MADNEEINDSPTEEELEELEKLLKELKELDEESKKSGKKRRRSLLTIEFGGVYHPNRIVNFLFSLLINISLSYTIISLFNFVEFENLYHYMGFIVTYSVIEWYVRDFITRRYLHLIIKSFGMIFYFSYLTLIFLLDYFVFVGNFTFKHATNVVAFLTIFVIVRYIIGTAIRRHFRRQLMR